MYGMHGTYKRSQWIDTDIELDLLWNEDTNTDINLHAQARYIERGSHNTLHLESQQFGCSLLCSVSNALMGSTVN